MKKFILSIDQGTTNSRVVLYSLKFNIVDIVQKEFKQFFPKNGWVEHDATEIWNDVKDVWTRDIFRNVFLEHDIIFCM